MNIYAVAVVVEENYRGWILQQPACSADGAGLRYTIYYWQMYGILDDMRGNIRMSDIPDIN